MKNKDIIYGIRPLIEAIKAGKEIDKIFIQVGLKSENFLELKALISQCEIPFQYVPIDKLNTITSQNHQGIIAYLSPIAYQPLENIVAACFEDGKNPLILILDSITDVRNFGAIARTAECAGVNAIVIPIKNTAQINADAVKTSAGALNIIPVCRSKNLKETVRFLKDSGLQIIACSESSKTNYYLVDMSLPVAIILGSEDVGISNDLLELSDYAVKIPLMGDIDSLNVSVAAGIVLFEAVKQRQTL